MKRKQLASKNLDSKRRQVGQPHSVQSTSWVGWAILKQLSLSTIRFSILRDSPKWYGISLNAVGVQNHQNLTRNRFMSKLQSKNSKHLYHF